LELQHRGAIDSPDLLLPAFHARAFSPRQRAAKAATVGRKGVPTAVPSPEDPRASIRRLSVQWPVRRRINLVAVNLLLLS